MLDRQVFLRPTAHRGLHDAKRAVIENTGPAFEAAIAKGYGIECDVRPAAGGLPVVFHDATLERLIDARGPIGEVEPDALKLLQHRAGGAPILMLAELLDLVHGRVPLLVEIKSEWGPPDIRFLAEIAHLASDYQKPIALMSFDPTVMSEIRRLAPGVPRGIVSGSYAGEGWWSGVLSKERGAALRDLRESEAVAPDFCAYQVDALPTPATEAARHEAHLPLFTWTVRTAKQREVAAKWADAMIFEGFEP